MQRRYSDDVQFWYNPELARAGLLWNRSYSNLTRKLIFSCFMSICFNLVYGVGQLLIMFFDMHIIFHYCNGLCKLFFFTFSIWLNIFSFKPVHSGVPCLARWAFMFYIFIFFHNNCKNVEFDFIAIRYIFLQRRMRDYKKLLLILNIIVKKNCCFYTSYFLARHNREEEAVHILQRIWTRNWAQTQY